MRTLSLLALPLLAAFAAACTSTSSSSSGSSGSSGSSSGSSGDPSGSSGGTPGANVAPIPATTLLYVARPSNDKHVLMSWDLEKDEKKVITDLTGDGSSGWDIAGYAISPDRTRIAIASLYDATKEDVATGFPGRRIHLVGADGNNFVRLTPVWENLGGGKKNWTVEVRDPMFTLDGKDVLFSYGQYWYEGTKLEGASSIWSVSAAGGKLPEPAWPLDGCSVTDASTDPKTGKVAVVQSVCIDSKNTGIWLYSRDGSSAPERVVGGASVDPDLEQVSWAKDGSGFVFVGQTERQVDGSSKRIRGVFAYDAASKQVIDIALPTGQDQSVRDATLAPDASAVVYCLVTSTQSGQTYDLHLVDVTANPMKDVALTNDGQSCNPRW